MHNREANVDRPSELLRLFGSWSGCLYLLFEDDNTACSQTYHTAIEGETEERKRLGKCSGRKTGGKAILLDPLAITCHVGGHVMHGMQYCLSSSQS